MIRKLVKKILGETLVLDIRNFKHKVGVKFYIEIENIKQFIKTLKIGNSSKYLDMINLATKKINEYSNSNNIVFHNPYFSGVTSATKELFERLVPMEDLYRNKDIKRIGDAILENGIKQVYFSAFCYNWDKLIKYIKNKNRKIIVKVYWHGSNSQINDVYGWDKNQRFIELERKGFVDQIALCKESMINFYKFDGINTHFLNNTVNFDGSLYKVKDTNNKEIRLGIYSANPEWRKNMMIHVASAKLIPNAVLDMVPINQEAKRFSELIGVKMDGLTNKVKREDLLARMAKNTVNLYVTFSECAPMLPIESLEVGVPCITGNNHHYFTNTELEKYLVVNNETDIEEVSKKIKLCIENKDKILSLYKEWKKKNDLLTKKQIKEFIGD